MVRSHVSHSQLVLSTVHSSQAAVSSVAASWCRSALRHGLDPSGLPRQERLGGAALDQLRDANGELLAVARPVLDRLLGHVGQTGCGVIISDLSGTILDARCGAGDAPLFDAAGLVAGASWSEASEGTNGIGTCLVEARAVTIHRHEHFASRNVDVSCMDAPIFDPVGQLVAALDVSSARADHGEAMARLISALVQDAARTIERDFFCQRYAAERIVLAEGSTQAPARGQSLLAVDRDNLVVGATRAARLHFGLGMQPRFDPRPLGDVLSQQQPALEDKGRAVLRQALARSGGNVAAAAKLLGIGRATFYRRMERAGLS
jgi:transcriptional regulator of acetoin/glycerol metabolism